MKKHYQWSIPFLILFSIIAIYSCTVDDEIVESSQLKFETASLKNAKSLFGYQVRNDKGSLDIFSTKSAQDSLVIPDWDSYVTMDLNFTDADLAIVQAKLNTNYEFDFKLIFMESNDSIIGAIEGRNLIQEKTDDQPRIEEVYFYDFTGRYYNGYRLTDDIATHQLVSTITQNASFGSLILNSISLNFMDCIPNLANDFPCYDDLDPVVLEVKKDPKPDPDHIYWDWLWHDFGGEAFNTYTLEDDNPTNGGGGANSDSGECNGGKVKNPITENCECPPGMIENDEGVCEQNCPDKQDRKNDTNKGFFTEKQVIDGDTVGVKKATLGLANFKDFLDSDLKDLAEGVEALFNNSGVLMDLDMRFDNNHTSDFLTLELIEVEANLQIDSLGGFLQYNAGNTVRYSDGRAHMQVVGFVNVVHADTTYQSFKVSKDLMVSNASHEFAHALRLDHIWETDNGVENIEVNQNNLLNSQENEDEELRANPGTEIKSSQKLKINEFITKIKRDGKDC